MRTIPVVALFLAACGTAPGALGPHDSTDDGVTWHGDVAPVVVQSCGGCHDNSGLSPFSVWTYDEAEPYAAAMLAAVASGSMPPFDAEETEACTPNAGFKHDPRLSEDELELLRTWVEAGAPEGDEATAAPLVEPSSERLEDPDAVVALENPFVVDGTADIYQCFRIEVPHDQDVWLTGVEVLPDNDRVVHHVLVWTDPDDASAGRDDGNGYRCGGTPGFYPTQLVATWAPGSPPTRPPENTGALFKKTTTLVVNVHYHPTGQGPETDQTEIALEWTTERPDNYVTLFLADLPFGARVQPDPANAEDTSFAIPADAEAHTERLILDPGDILPFDLPVYGLTPHMHYLGTEMQVKILHDDGSEECLVHTPEYRFDWQSTYVYDAPVSELPVFGRGDKLEILCKYNNSWSNPHMADALAASGREAPADIRWGEETGDEMCMAMLGLITPPIDLDSLVDLF